MTFETPHGVIHLPKPYLSYSALSLWKRDPVAFRAKYYDGVTQPETRYTIFGSEVHKLIEDGGMKHVPRYKKAEYAIEVVMDGIPVMGYLDSFCPARKAFLDYKTGIRLADGSPRWNAVEVQKLDQLPFYSLLIKEKYGTVQPTSKLVWLETAWVPSEETITFEGTTLTRMDQKLALTGTVEVFKRRIDEHERIRMRSWIIESAKEISEDYSLFGSV